MRAVLVVRAQTSEGACVSGPLHPSNGGSPGKAASFYDEEPALLFVRPDGLRGIGIGLRNKKLRESVCSENEPERDTRNRFTNGSFAEQRARRSARKLRLQ